MPNELACSADGGGLDARPCFKIATPAVASALTSHGAAPRLTVSRPIGAVLKCREICPRPDSLSLCGAPASLSRAAARVEVIGHARPSSFAAQDMHARQPCLIGQSGRDHNDQGYCRLENKSHRLLTSISFAIGPTQKSPTPFSGGGSRQHRYRENPAKPKRRGHQIATPVDRACPCNASASSAPEQQLENYGARDVSISVFALAATPYVRSARHRAHPHSCLRRPRLGRSRKTPVLMHMRVVSRPWPRLIRQAVRGLGISGRPAPRTGTRKHPVELWRLHHSRAGAPVLPFRVCFLVGTEEAAMANFVRSATIMLMGATVVAAGVVVVLYS